MTKNTMSFSYSQAGVLIPAAGDARAELPFTEFVVPHITSEEAALAALTVDTRRWLERLRQQPYVVKEQFSVTKTPESILHTDRSCRFPSQRLAPDAVQPTEIADQETKRALTNMVSSLPLSASYKKMLLGDLSVAAKAPKEVLQASHACSVCETLNLLSREKFAVGPADMMEIQSGEYKGLRLSASYEKISRRYVVPRGNQVLLDRISASCIVNWIVERAFHEQKLVNATKHYTTSVCGDVATLIREAPMPTTITGALDVDTADGLLWQLFAILAVLQSVQYRMATREWPLVLISSRYQYAGGSREGRLTLLLGDLSRGSAAVDTAIGKVNYIWTEDQVLLSPDSAKEDLISYERSSSVTYEWDSASRVRENVTKGAYVYEDIYLLVTELLLIFGRSGVLDSLTPRWWSLLMVMFPNDEVRSEYYERLERAVGSAEEVLRGFPLRSDIAAAIGELQDDLSYQFE